MLCLQGAVALDHPRLRPARETAASEPATCERTPRRVVAFTLKADLFKCRRSARETWITISAGIESIAGATYLGRIAWPRPYL